MRDQPLLDPLVEVAVALGELRERVVFIGGMIAPLLHQDPPFDGPRPTRDVDAIAATTSYLEFGGLSAELRQRGFHPEGIHAHRWVTPGSKAVPFDLVPLGDYLGASGNEWDVAAVETAVRREIAPGTVIRHASAAGFLALKFAAFHDRGQEAAYFSEDLEDIFALIASRPRVVEEIERGDARIRRYLRVQSEALRSRPDFEDLLTAHLGNVARGSGRIVVETENRLTAISIMGD